MVWSSRLHRNSFFSFLSSSVRMGGSMLLFVGIARLYGTEAFGRFTAAHVYLTLFLPLADFGLDLLLASEIARDRFQAVSLFRRLISVKLITGSVATLAMCSIAFVSGMSAGTTVMTILLSVSVLGTTLSTFFYAVCRGFEELHHEMRVTAIQQAVMLVALIGLGISGVPIIWVAAAFVASRLLGLVLIARTVRHRFGVHLGHVSFQHWKGSFVQSLPFGMNLLFGALYFQLDTLLIASWLGDHSAGIYQSAMKLVVVVLAVPDVITSALLPVFSRLYVEDRSRWETVVRVSSKTLLYLCLPFVLLFVVYPGVVLSVVYGAREFDQAIPVLETLGVVLLVRFAVEIYGLVLTTTRNQTTRMWIVFAAAILNCGLNIYAIPRYGVLGAAWVSLICNIFVGLSYGLAAGMVGFGLKSLLESRVLVALTLTGVVAVGLWYLGGNAAITGIAIVLLGVPILLYSLGYTREERKMVFTLPAGITRVNID